MANGAWTRDISTPTQFFTAPHKMRLTLQFSWMWNITYIDGSNPHVASAHVTGGTFCDAGQFAAGAIVVQCGEAGT